MLAVAMLREGFEDFSRFKSDKELNSSECYLFKDNEYIDFKWKDL